MLNRCYRSVVTTNPAPYCFLLRLLQLRETSAPPVVLVMKPQSDRKLRLDTERRRRVTGVKLSLTKTALNVFLKLSASQAELRLCER